MRPRSATARPAAVSSSLIERALAGEAGTAREDGLHCVCAARADPTSRPSVLLHLSIAPAAPALAGGSRGQCNGGACCWGCEGALAWWLGRAAGAHVCRARPLPPVAASQITCASPTLCPLLCVSTEQARATRPSRASSTEESEEEDEEKKQTDDCSPANRSEVDPLLSPVTDRGMHLQIAAYIHNTLPPLGPCHSADE